MKLWSSFVKELKISSRGFYFYIELFMAFVLLFVLLFVVPDEFVNKEEEFVYLDFPKISLEQKYFDTFEDLDGQPEAVTLKLENKEINARLYENSGTKIYVIDSKTDMIRLAESRHKIGAAVTMDADNYEMRYTYYLQGNETERLKSLILILHGTDDEALFNASKSQPVRSLSNGHVQLTDRENLLPVFLTFNGSLMGFFIIAAYIFLDKKEGVIKAYAVTASPLWIYLLSKVLVLTVTMLVTSLVIIAPLMGMRVNYMILCAFLIATGLFASGLGLVVAGYFDDMVKSFGVMYLLMIGMMLPALAYFSPSWNPIWLKFIPSYYIVFGFKEIFINGNINFVLLYALVYLVAAGLLFLWAHTRFKRSMSI